MDRFARLLDEGMTAPLGGWEFTRFGDRLSTEPAPWDFADLVLPHARTARSMLDLGTGGGERLAALTMRPAVTVATESWPPNVPVAAARLAPLGVPVLQSEGAPDNDVQDGTERGRLPLRTGSFDLVLSRHESYWPAEVARVLTPGGTFLTQQVGAGAADDFRDLLGRPPAVPGRWLLGYATEQLAGAGLRVLDGAEGAWTLVLADVAVLVWYLRMAPWLVPGFEPRREEDRLRAVQRTIDRSGPVRVRQPLFWLLAAGA